ncbi:MAG: dephospho-CoA kinase [Lachnospiraceae bacterium]|nr:dephospho-CoA kinase [Ruminococcus sp.]MCM1274128.1 dephospho-CoA kinase [Lachnospiraceae bacterium]
MVNLPNIMIIGLTGQSGAGKSTVCAAFAERGFTVVDCDGIARKTADNGRFLGEISERFDENLLNADGTLNREKTAKLIFTDGEKREKYQRIIFPYIVNSIMREIRAAGGNVLLDAPTLFEAKLDMLCGKVVSVTADTELCERRITERDGITPERARERLSAQRGADFFRERSDYTIENNGTREELILRAAAIIDKLKGDGKCTGADKKGARLR